jgi:nitrous oxide reductase accessory protein NosL
MKRLCILILALLLAGCAGAEAVTSPSSIPLTIAPTTEQATPVLIKEWQGSGIKTTEPFTVSQKPWGIAWAHRPDEYGGMLQIMVYDASRPDELVSLAANTNVGGSDSSYVYETGTFYLTINSANTKWDVRVVGVP